MTIRERIERERKSGIDPLYIALLNDWEAGNLLPADEVDARIEAAVAMAVARERQRCDRKLCQAWHSVVADFKLRPGSAAEALLGRALEEIRQEGAAAARKETDHDD